MRGLDADLVRKLEWSEMTPQAYGGPIDTSTYLFQEDRGCRSKGEDVL